MTLDCWRLLHFRRDAAGWLPLVFAALALVVKAGSAAAAEPPGAPLNDPELAALLRPSQPIVDEHLTRGEDEYVYYSAKLKQIAAPGFTKRYLAELEDRGVRIRPIGNSPHATRQRIIGYDFLAWQEASLDPYTIRFREGEDREETMGQEPPLRPNYAHPMSVTLDRLVVRLPAEFAKPWTTAVVVPKENQAKLPFLIPLPPDAVVLRLSETKYLELIGGEWRPTSLRQIRVGILSHMAPPDVGRFFKQALQGWGKVVREEGNTLTWGFGPVPPWAPANSDYVYVDPTDNTLFAHGTIGVAHFTAADTFQLKTLPHLPQDVRSYLIVVGLKKEHSK